VPPDRLKAFQAAANNAGVAITDIGLVTAGEQPPRFVLDGRLLNFARRSFSHF
jgi:thiamine-monophosphate kinase